MRRPPHIVLGYVNATQVSNRELLPFKTYLWTDRQVLLSDGSIINHLKDLKDHHRKGQSIFIILVGKFNRETQRTGRVRIYSSGARISTIVSRLT